MKRFLRIGGSGVLLLVIGWRIDWSRVVAQSADLRWDAWLGAILLFIFAQVVSARRWQLFAQQLHFQRPFSRYCGDYFAGMFFNLILPTSVGGDVMRVAYLNDGSGRKWPAFLSVFLERASGLAVLILLACIGVFCTAGELPGWISASVWGIALAMFAGAAFGLILRRCQLLTAHHQTQIDDAVNALTHRAVFIETTLLSVLTQLAGVLIVWLLARGLVLDISFAYCCVVAPLVVFLTMLPISVNGIGVREGSLVLLLAPLGISSDSAVSLGFAWFAAGVAVSLLGGVVHLIRGFTPQRSSASAQASQIM